MTIQELYEREPQETSFDTWHLQGCYFNHFPEINRYEYDIQNGANTRVETRWLKYFQFDGHRIWALGTLWLDGKPFMVIQNAGRDGDDHHKRFITDADLYLEAWAYLRSLQDVKQSFEVTPTDVDMKELTSFCGNHLDGYFERSW